MKTIILNGSPRKSWNTAQLLQKARRGAVDAGQAVEYFDLYDLNFTGCRSCLACKRKDIPDPCKCYWQDGLTSLLEQVRKADRLILGSPIYYGEPTGVLRCFLERLVFPVMSYNDYSSIYPGHTDVDIFLTMNVGSEQYRQQYEAKFQDYFQPLHFLNGVTRIIPVCDTLQAEDYGRYNMAGFSEAHKKMMRETQFPADLTQAYQIGAGSL